MNITVKKNKNGTFLDLSNEDLNSRNFITDFSKFTKQVENFLAGTSVSLIVPNESEKFNLDGVNVIDKLKEELNRRNISLKAVVNELVEEIKSEKPKEKSIKEKQTQEEKEIIDTTGLPETLYVKANLRSGQLIKYPGNVFVLGDVNPSAEIIADGDVIIWGTLRGIIHAGASGNNASTVIAMDIKEGQIRIANKLASLNKKRTSSKSSNGTKVPLLAKLENNEIIVTRYF